MSGKEKSSYLLTLAQTPPLITSHSTGFSVTSPTHHPLKTMVRGQLEPTESIHERGMLKFPFVETSYESTIPLIQPWATHTNFPDQSLPQSTKHSRFICLLMWSLLGGMHREKCYTWEMRAHYPSICLQHRYDRQTGSTGTPICNSLSACRWHPASYSWWMIRLLTHCQRARNTFAGLSLHPCSFLQPSIPLCSSTRLFFGSLGSYFLPKKCIKLGRI